MIPQNPKRLAAKILLVFSLLILLSPPLLVAEETAVRWEKKVLNFTPAPHDKKVKGRFTFINTSDSPIRIDKVTATCGCTAVETTANKNNNGYAPGEKGHINVSVNFAPGSGRQTKYVYVTFTDGKTIETTKLGVVIDASPYVDVKPNLMFWRQNEDNPESQNATVTVLADTPIHLARMEKDGETDAFSVTHQTIQEGREYEVTVKPRDTTRRHNLTLTLYTDFPSTDNPLQYKLTASITPSAATSPGSSQTSFWHGIVGNKNSETLIVLGLSVLGGTSIALLLFALAGKSGHKRPPHNENNG